MQLSKVKEATFTPTLRQRPRWEELWELAQQSEKYRRALFTNVTEEFIEDVKEETNQNRSIALEIMGETRSGKSLVGLRLLNRYLEKDFSVERIVRPMEEQEKLLKSLEKKRGEGKRVGWIMVDEQEREEGDNSMIDRRRQRNWEDILAEDMVNWLFISAERKQHRSTFVLEPIRATWTHNVPDKKIVDDAGLTEYTKRAKKIVKSGGITECFVQLKKGDDLTPYGTVYFKTPEDYKLIAEYLKTKREYNKSLIRGSTKTREQDTLDYIFSDTDVLYMYMRATTKITSNGVSVKQTLVRAALKDDPAIDYNLSNKDVDNISHTFEKRVREMYYNEELDKDEVWGV